MALNIYFLLGALYILPGRYAIAQSTTTLLPLAVRLQCLTRRLTRQTRSCGIRRRPKRRPSSAASASGSTASSAAGCQTCSSSRWSSRARDPCSRCGSCCRNGGEWRPNFSRRGTTHMISVKELSASKCVLSSACAPAAHWLSRAPASRRVALSAYIVRTHNELTHINSTTKIVHTQWRVGCARCHR